MKNKVEVIVRDSHGREKFRTVVTNLRTLVGASWFFAQLFSIAPSGAALFAGLSTDITAPSTADVGLPNEQTANGLNRAQLVPAYSAGAAITALTNTFTYTGVAPITITKAGLFNSLSGGVLVFETLFGVGATLNQNDQLAFSWTVNF